MQTELGLEHYDYGARFYDPVIGRFTTEDPHSENYYAYSPYVYVGNNPLRRTDPTGMDWWDEIKKKAKDVVQSVSATASATLVKANEVRKEYIAKVSSLEPTDSKGRTQAKVEARAKTPAVMKAVAENMRPIEKEASRVAGTASKTNASVNNTVLKLGNVGKVAGVAAVGISVYNVATSDNKPQATTHEVGVLAGAVAGGEAGAAGGAVVGAFFGGAGAVPGAVIGGIGGSVVGGIAGGRVADKMYDTVTGWFKD